MEGGGGRLGRSSTRYGPTTVFTGPVRKWKKKWIHVTPPNTTNGNNNNNNNHNNHQSSNGKSSANDNNDNGSHLMLYKWTPISQTDTQNTAVVDNDSNADGKDDVADVDDDEPPRRKIKYIPIALLEEQKKESEENIDESVETDADLKDNKKPDINDVPMEQNKVSGEAGVGRQDLNENTLDLNARDGEEELEETKDET